MKLCFSLCAYDFIARKILNTAHNTQHNQNAHWTSDACDWGSFWDRTCGGQGVHGLCFHLHSFPSSLTFCLGRNSGLVVRRSCSWIGTCKTCREPLMKSTAYQQQQRQNHQSHLSSMFPPRKWFPFEHLPCRRLFILVAAALLGSKLC